MKKFTLKNSTLGTGALLVVGLLFVGVLLLADSLLRGAKIDLTSDNLHSLSDGTERIVRGLKEPVNVYFFFSKNTAAEYPQIKNYGTHVQELLEELASQSKGKLTLKVIDPQPFSEDEDRATELGITSEQVNATGDRLFFGIAATNSTDGKDAIPVLDPKLEEQLEYEVAKLIYKVASSSKPVVGWLSSLPMQGDFDMQTGRPKPPWAVYGQIEQLYTVRPLQPTLTSIDDDVSVLVLVHPKNLSPSALYAIDQYAMRGGHILAFVDPNAQADQSSPPDPNNPMSALAADRSSHLEPLLASWGVNFPANQVVVDLERGITVQVRQGEAPLQHIAILGFTHDSMAKDVVTAELDTVNMVTAGSLTPVAGSKLKFEPLIRTSKQAGLLPVERFAMLQDADSLRDGFRPTGDFVVAARVSGEATSAFAAAPPAGVTAKPDALKASSKPLNVVVVADSDLLSDLWWTVPRNFFGQTVFQPIANNGELAWNAIDNLSGSGDLISIRGRAAYSRPFTRVDELRRAANNKFRATEQQLQEQLQKTEERLTQLQTKPGGNELIVSPDAMNEIEKFQAEKLRIRKELRAVNAGLEEDIRDLGITLKLINILAVPVLVAIMGLLVAFWRRQRRRAITMLRSQGVAS